MRLIHKNTDISHIDEQDEAGTTALHVAATIGNDQVVKALLKNKANINKQDNNVRCLYFNFYFLPPNPSLYRVILLSFSQM